MAEQNAAGWSTPYKFTGKELDDITGLYYFGARYYDPRISLWMSVDPLAEKYPGWSPYRYGFNNPMINIDPDGRFGIPIHRRIMNSAIDQSGVKMRSIFKSDLVQGATVTADYIGALSDLHFDGRKNFTEVSSKWNSLNNELSNTISKIGGGNKLLGGPDVDKLGNLIHNVQDFYAHSNYVELYTEYYQSVNNGALPTDIPMYDEGVKIQGFKDLMMRNTYDENGKYQGLHTGIYDFTKKDGGTGPNSHSQMNKDKATGRNGILAEKTALKHSIKILKNLE